MKRCLAALLCVLMMLTATPLVSADNNYNDDQFDWGEYACPHTHTEEVAEIPSTCITPGRSAYTRCVDCKLLVAGSKDPLPLAEHIYDNACDEDCNVCGTVREVGDHDYTLVVTDATCTADGKKVYTCANCGDSYTDTIPAVGHKSVVVEGYAATCEADGLTDGEQCSVCGEVLVAQQVIPATGHDYHSAVTTPDCENSGYTVHTCTICGHSYVDNRVDALGHNYQVTENVDPTCVAAGKKVYVCANCGDSYVEAIPATGRHTYDYVCDEDCNVCGYIRKDAHVYTFMGTIEPTCGEDGSEGYKCWECGGYMYVTLPATGNHTYSGVCDAACNVCNQIREPVDAHTYVLTEEVDATCIADGKQVYTCQGCGDSYTNRIVSEGHKYHIVVTAPTCEQGGYTTHTCTACGDVCVDNRTDALGHTAAVLKGYAATCETDGLTDGEKCSVCGEILVAQQVIPAIGHDYKLIEDKAPTCGVDGKKVYTCANCDASYTEVIEAVGHAAVVLKGYAATCETDGLTSGVMCAVCGEIKIAQKVIPALGHSYDDDMDADCNTCGAVREVIVRGDANGDGKVNNRDLGTLQRYLNGFEITLNEVAMDLNDDGKVNNRDLGKLQQMLNR